MRSLSSKGRFLNRKAFARVNTVTFAPIPRASARTATAVKPGARARPRTAYLRSALAPWNTSRMVMPPRASLLRSVAPSRCGYTAFTKRLPPIRTMARPIVIASRVTLQSFNMTLGIGESTYGSDKAGMVCAYCSRQAGRYGRSMRTRPPTCLAKAAPPSSCGCISA